MRNISRHAYLAARMREIARQEEEEKIKQEKEVIEQGSSAGFVEGQDSSLERVFCTS